MNNKFLFSVVIAIFNTEKYLTDAIESILNQTFGFDKIQLILVDDGSTDKSEKICKKYQKKYPNNIKYIYKENGGQSTARNLGIKFAEGKYVNFMDSDDKFELNAFQEVYNFFEKYGEEIDVVSTPRYYFGAKEGPLSLNYRFSETRVIDIFKEFNCPQLSISCTFIRRDALDIEFDSRLIISEDATLINKIILKKSKYGVVNTTKYLYRRREEETSTINTKKLNKDYFTTRLYFYNKSLIDYSIEKFGNVPKYVQFALMFDLQWMYEENTIRNVLDNVEFLQYESLLFNILQYIDDDIILAQKYLNKYLKYHILKFKHNYTNFQLIQKNDDLLLKCNENILDNIKSNEINLIDYYIKDNILCVKGEFNSCFEEVKILAYNKDNELRIYETECEQEFSLGNQVSNNHYFIIEVPLTSKTNKISLYIEINSNKYSVNLNNINTNLNIENNTINYEVKI